MMPGPPPVMIAKPCLARSFPTSRAASYIGSPGDVAEHVEALDELARHPHDAPRVGAAKIGRHRRAGEELLILELQLLGITDRVVDAHLATGGAMTGNQAVAILGDGGAFRAA